MQPEQVPPPLPTSVRKGAFDSLCDSSRFDKICGFFHEFGGLQFIRDPRLARPGGFALRFSALALSTALAAFNSTRSLLAHSAPVPLERFPEASMESRTWQVVPPNALRIVQVACA